MYQYLSRLVRGGPPRVDRSLRHRPRTWSVAVTGGCWGRLKTGINVLPKSLAHLTRVRMTTSLLSLASLAVFYASASGLIVENASQLPSLTYDYIVVGGELSLLHAAINSP
jgi:hypothetical protein